MPGAGHLWLGESRKGLTFLVVIPAMFVIGVLADGRLFPFDVSEPLVALAALAHVGNGLPYLLASAVGAGVGNIRSVSHEYGNALLIVAGLLNALVVLDASDLVRGRRSRA